MTHAATKRAADMWPSLDWWFVVAARLDHFPPALNSAQSGPEKGSPLRTFPAIVKFWKACCRWFSRRWRWNRRLAKGLHHDPLIHLISQSCFQVAADVAIRAAWLGRKWASTPPADSSLAINKATLPPYGPHP